MASIKLLAIIIFWAALLSGHYIHIIWSAILWEIGGGFNSSTVLWMSEFGKDDHDR